MAANRAGAIGAIAPSAVYDRNEAPTERRLIMAEPRDPDSRLDKLLWALRFYRTRPLAADACEAGHAAVGGLAAKPGRKVHAGEIIRLRLPGLTRTFRVTALPRSRVAAKQVPAFAEDLTPPDEYERARQAAREHALARQRSGGGRPTKKDRRDLSKLLGL